MTPIDRLLEKLAMNRMTKELLKKSPTGQRDMLKAMAKGGRQTGAMTPQGLASGQISPAIRAQQGRQDAVSSLSYKGLSNKLRNAVDTSMPESGAGGHASGHVWNVTKNTQGLLGGREDVGPSGLLSQPSKFGAGHVAVGGGSVSPEIMRASGIDPRSVPTKEVYRRGVLGALAHDTGRPVEIKARNSREAFHGTKRGGELFGQGQKSGELAHSEASGRHIKNLLAQNAHLVENVPGLLHNGKGSPSIRNAVRAHDTDAHSLYPWAKPTIENDPAARAVYVGDKMESAGQEGIHRTTSFGAHLGNTPEQNLWQMASNNPKHDYALSTIPEHDVGARKAFSDKITEYRRGIHEYATQNNLPPPPGSISPTGEVVPGKLGPRVKGKPMHSVAGSGVRPIPGAPAPTAGLVQQRIPTLQSSAAPAPAPVAPPAQAAPAAQPPQPAPQPMMQQRPQPMARPPVRMPMMPPPQPQMQQQIGKVAMIQPPVDLEKVAMAVQDYVNLYTKAAVRNTRPKVIARAMRMLSRKNPRHMTEAFAAIQYLPAAIRMKFTNIMAGIK